MSTITRRPTRLAGGVSLLSGLGAVASTIPNPMPGAVIAAIGLIAIAGSLATGSRRLLDAGSLVLFVGVVASADGAPVTGPLVGTIALLVAWDLGALSIKLGDQLGREAATARLESWYILSSTAVGVATGGVAYGVYLGSRGLTLDALTAILLTGICATLALGARFGWNESVIGQS